MYIRSFELIISFEISVPKHRTKTNNFVKILCQHGKYRNYEINVAFKLMNSILILLV